MYKRQIITDNQGRKFGKSEGNAMWLDPSMLSPYRFYQFWFNQPDDEVVKLLKVFTFLPKDEIERLAQQIQDDPGSREAQRVLAWEVTSFVHGEDVTNQAIAASSALFGKGDLTEIDEQTLEAALDGVKVKAEDGSLEFAKSSNGTRVVEAAVAAGLFHTISEARRAIEAGGLYVNNERVSSVDDVLDDHAFLHNRFALLRRGKKAIGAVERA